MTLLSTALQHFSGDAAWTCWQLTFHILTSKLIVASSATRILQKVVAIRFAIVPQGMTCEMTFFLACEHNAIILPITIGDILISTLNRINFFAVNPPRCISQCTITPLASIKKMYERDASIFAIKIRICSYSDSV